MRDKFLYIIFIFQICSLTVSADSFNFPSSRADALGGTSQLSTPLPSEQLLSGASIGNLDKLNVDFGYKRKYSLKELDHIFSAISYRYKQTNVIIGYSQLGDPNLYTQNNLRIGMLYTKSFVTIGNFVTTETHNFNNHYESVHGYSYSFSILLKQKDFILSSVFDNFNKPKLTSNSQKIESKFSFYGELLTKNNYKTLLRYVTQKGKKDIFGIGESIYLFENASILFGFSTAPITFGGGLELTLHKHRFIYNTEYHPVLGLSHTISFSTQILAR